MGLLKKLKGPEEENKEPEELIKEGKVSVDEKKLLYINNQLSKIDKKLDNLSDTIGKVFMAIEEKINSNREGIEMIEEDVRKQAEQDHEFKSQIKYEYRETRKLIRKIGRKIKSEIEGKEKEPIPGRVDINLILNAIKEKEPIEINDLINYCSEEDICSRATLFRKLKTLKNKGFIVSKEKEGKVYYSISKIEDTDTEKEEKETREEDKMETKPVSKEEETDTDTEKEEKRSHFLKILGPRPEKE